MKQNTWKFPRATESLRWHWMVPEYLTTVASSRTVPPVQLEWVTPFDQWRTRQVTSSFARDFLFLESWSYRWPCGRCYTNSMQFTAVLLKLKQNSRTSTSMKKKKQLSIERAVSRTPTFFHQARRVGFLSMKLYGFNASSSHRQAFAAVTSKLHKDNRYTPKKAMEKLKTISDDCGDVRILELTRQCSL